MCACVLPGPGAGPEVAGGASPELFVEARPRLSASELFSELRGHGVEVWIAADRRLGLRMYEAGEFEAACELIAELDHEIEYLDLAFLPIDDLGPLMHVRSTETLDLSGARADLRPLRHLTELRGLSLAATDYGSLAPLAELDELETLDLSGARAKLTGVAGLLELRELRLTHARSAPRGFELRDGPGLEIDALHDLAKLEVLSLSHSKVRDWAPLAELWTLRQLDLAYTNFADLGLLETFAELETLNLRRTAVVDLSPLARLDALRRVDLRDCELVDDASLAWLRRARPELELVL
jgi:Leucine-rich repeat (LRR) protein